MNDLRTVRKEKRLSQQDLSDLIGMSQSALTEVETGKRLPQRKTRERVEQILGSEIDWLSTLASDRGHIGYALNELINSGEPGLLERLKFCRQYLHALETLTQQI